MLQKNINPQPQKDENVEQTNNTENVNGDQYESDTQRIIHRHLQNKDDIITDEDIASVRVGMTPQFDEATEERFDNDEKLDQIEDEILGNNEDTEKGEATPWDTVDPT